MVEYELKRSKRKTLSLHITPEATVIVRAPMRAANRDIDRFVYDHLDWILRHLEKQRLYIKSHPPVTEAEIESLRNLAKTAIPRRVAHYAAIMRLCPAAVKINAAKTRFGSCSSKNNLNFSCLLMRYPIEAIDYVVVHELAHIVHKNHGNDFYRLIESVLPDWQARRKLLRNR